MDVAAGEGQVVVDAGAGLARAGLAAAARAGGVLLVCPPTLAGARRARRLLDALATRGAGGRSALVVGAGPGGGELGARALGNALVGVDVVGEVPWARREARRAQRGAVAIGARRRPRGRAPGRGHPGPAEALT